MINAVTQDLYLSDKSDQRLIVFDEASQICTEDALPAIIRGKQVVITGDNKQLPPTSFFKVSELSEYDSEEDAGDYLYENMDRAAKVT